MTSIKGMKRVMKKMKRFWLHFVDCIRMAGHCIDRSLRHQNNIPRSSSGVRHRRRNRWSDCTHYLRLEQWDGVWPCLTRRSQSESRASIMAAFLRIHSMEESKEPWSVLIKSSQDKIFRIKSFIEDLSRDTSLRTEWCLWSSLNPFFFRTRK
jgi:hypothetical protein